MKENLKQHSVPIHKKITLYELMQAYYERLKHRLDYQEYKSVITDIDTAFRQEDPSCTKLFDSRYWHHLIHDLIDNYIIDTASDHSR